MLRPTGARVPADAAVCNASGLPFGMLVSPLAASPKPRLTPAVDAALSEAARDAHIAASALGAHDVPRCAACAGYISAKCGMNARYWRCALCAVRNDLPARYAPTVLANDPEAIELVPELSRDVYDLPVFEPPYTGDEYVPPAAYIFVLDSCGDAAYLDAARVAIKSALDVVEGESLVGIVLYEEGLSFLDARGKTGILRRISALDTDLSISEVFPPDQWLRQSGPAFSTLVIDTLATLMPVEDPTPTTPAKRALGSAVRAALDMIEAAELLAARVVVIGAGEPNHGDGAIIISNEPVASRDKLPVPITPFYSDLGARASLLGAMVDVYLVSRMPVDVASISPLVQTSGGRLILYEAAEETLSQDIWQHLNDAAVVRGLLRIRTSSEFHVGDVYGAGVYRDVEVQNVFRLSCHGHLSTLAVEFEFTGADGFSKEAGRGPNVQIAFRGVFLEPGKLPQRILRIESHSYPISSSRAVLRAEADANAITTLIFHKAMAAADDEGIGAARMLLFDWLANLLAKTAVTSNDDETRVLDSTMQNYPSIKTLPRLVFGLIRSFLFRQEAVAPELRAALRCIWEDLNPELLAAAAYPRLFSFLNLEEKSIKELPLSSLAVKQSGHPIFMLDAFSEVVIYYATPSRRDLVFPPPESSNIMRVRAACIRDRPITPKCVVCREGTSKDRWFKSFLIEDPVPGAAAQSFASFMQGITDAAEELIDGLQQ